MSRIDDQAMRIAAALGLPLSWVQRRVDAGITDPAYLRTAYAQQYKPVPRLAGPSARGGDLPSAAARRPRTARSGSKAAIGRSATCQRCGNKFAGAHGRSVCYFCTHPGPWPGAPRRP
jgi:hypothetical protein